MATLEGISGRDSTKHTGGSFASNETTLRSASPAGPPVTAPTKVRFDSLPSPRVPHGKRPGPEKPKPTLAQIFDLDRSFLSEKTLSSFQAAASPAEAASSEDGSGGDDSGDELQVHMGEDEQLSPGDCSSASESAGSPERDQLDPRQMSVDDCSTEAATATAPNRANTPLRLEVPAPASPDVTPTTVTNINLEPPPVQSKSLKIEHVLEVRTPTKVRFTLQPPESATPASVDLPSSEIRQPTQKLKACEGRRLNIAEVKRYLSYAQLLKNEKCKAKLLSLPQRVSLEKMMKHLPARVRHRRLKNAKRPEDAGVQRRYPPGTAEAVINGTASRNAAARSPSSDPAEVTAEDVVAFMAECPALVSPPVTANTDLDLVARLTPVLIQEVREKISSFVFHLKDAEQRGEALAPYMGQWKAWVSVHNAFVLHDKLCDAREV